MQSRIDSVMETVTSTIIGFLISLITWRAVSLAYGIPMPLMENLQITAIFTAVSLGRGFFIRRLFNGRGVWQAIKDRFGDPLRFFRDALAEAKEVEASIEDRAEQARLRVQQLIGRP